MRSVVSEDAKVGLLLFDEPSASLDPTAEHGTSHIGSTCIGGSYTGRSLCTTARAARQQDDGLLLSPFREPHPARRPDFVRPPANMSSPHSVLTRRIDI